MLKKFLAALSGRSATDARAGDIGSFSPYAEPYLNGLYNLLFCDDLELFRNHHTAKGDGPWSTLLAEKPDLDALHSLAEDENEESRVRALAYTRLRAAGQAVPKGKVLGVIVEVPLEQGLDMLAAFADGRVRYLNQSGKVTIFEGGGPPRVEALAKDLVAVARPVVNQTNPSSQKRLPPPRGADSVRMTILASDGLYVGEGSFDVLEKDATGAPVIAKATQLLQAVTQTG